MLLEFRPLPGRPGRAVRPDLAAACGRRAPALLLQGWKDAARLDFKAQEGGACAEARPRLQICTF